MVRFKEVAKYGRRIGGRVRPSRCRALAKSSAHKGMMIGQPEELATTLKRAVEMTGPVVVGIPVDYRDNQRLMEIVHPSAHLRNPSSLHRGTSKAPDCRLRSM